MNRTWLAFGLAVALLVSATLAARGGGRGRMGGRKGQKYGSRVPVLIIHKNPASASYYEHKDVRALSGYLILISGLVSGRKDC